MPLKYLPLAYQTDTLISSHEKALAQVPRIFLSFSFFFFTPNFITLISFNPSLTAIDREKHNLFCTFVKNEFARKSTKSVSVELIFNYIFLTLLLNFC